MKRLTAKELAAQITQFINTSYNVEVQEATNEEIFYSLAAVVNEQIKPLWFDTKNRYKSEQAKQVYYLSMEFLIGRFNKKQFIEYRNVGRCEPSISGAWV